VAPKKKATKKRTVTESSLSDPSHGGYTDDEAVVEMIKPQQ